VTVTGQILMAVHSGHPARNLGVSGESAGLVSLVVTGVLEQVAVEPGPVVGGEAARA
jgi:hypothetical protein